VAIDFQGLIKSGLIALASGAVRRIGFEKEDLREPLSRIFLNCQVATSHIRHVIDKNLALAAVAAGLDYIDCQYRFPISVSPADERFAKEAAAGCDRFAIINPGGGWPTKLWPPERYGQLADWLLREYHMVSLVTYGPGEEALASSVVESSKSGAARSIKSTLKQFVALARRAALFVGGDTGPLHLAAAAGTPVVGIYGPTRPERNGPFSARDIALGRDLWCRTHCYRRSCWHWECMDIPLSQVQRAVSERLKHV
jgi:ADP-heptose:LPS heptosyltransferase